MTLCPGKTHRRIRCRPWRRDASAAWKETAQTWPPRQTEKTRPRLAGLALLTFFMPTQESLQ